MSRSPVPFGLPKPFRRRLGGYICPSCQHQRFSSSQSWPRQPLPLQSSQYRTSTHHQTSAYPSDRRYASIVSSPTHVNAPTSIPDRNRPLYAALEDLKVKAGTYTPLSRLQLALKGLESTDPVTRIAVLALDSDTREARKLVRLLLADPLSPEELWERAMDAPTAGPEVQDKALLVRHGKADEGSAKDERVVKTLLAESRVLKKENLEILIAGLSTRGPVPEPLDAMLVPALASPSGTWVTYPVHKTILLGRGLQSAVEYGRFTAGVDEVPESMVRLAVSLPAPAEEPKEESGDVRVDVKVAEEAVGMFRESIANAVKYEQKWFRSGFPSLTNWMTPQSPASDSSSEPMKPALMSLIDSLLSTTRTAILAESTRTLATQSTFVLPSATKQSILLALSNWSERAHLELRDTLDLAFSGRHWRKIKWWKLFWRVDDVGAIASDILERRWLTDAEKGIIYVAGRLEEAGVSPNTSKSSWLNLKPTAPTQRQAPIAVDVDTETRVQAPTLGRLGSRPKLLTVGDLWKRGAEGKDNGEVLFPRPAPWPQQIPLTRSAIASTSIPSLQALAQTLVLQTLSTSAISGALSALTYVSFPTFEVLESGTIAALGVTWALRRMQTKWEGARELFEGEVREEGRTVLKGMEEEIRGSIEDVGRKTKSIEGEEQRREALEAVTRAEEALSKLK